MATSGGVVCEASSDNSRLFYCHQCNHQWRKNQAAEYLCPQCQEGFIEEVDNTTDFPSNRANGSSPRNSDPFISLVNRIMRRATPTRVSRRNRNTIRSRSRSPGATTSSRTAEIRNRTREAIIEMIHPHTSRRLERTRTLNFALDDFMSSFLSSPRPPAMGLDKLLTIPEITITIEQTNEKVQCSVCFDEFKLNEKGVKKLSCNHLYHGKCIFPWLRISASCPVCRANLNTGNADASNSLPQPDSSLNYLSDYDTFLRRVMDPSGQIRQDEPSTSTTTDDQSSSSSERQPPRSRLFEYFTNFSNDSPSTNTSENLRTRNDRSNRAVNLQTSSRVLRSNSAASLGQEVLPTRSNTRPNPSALPRTRFMHSALSETESHQSRYESLIRAIRHRPYARPIISARAQRLGSDTVIDLTPEDNETETLAGALSTDSISVASSTDIIVSVDEGGFTPNLSSNSDSEYSSINSDGDSIQDIPDAPSSPSDVSMTTSDHEEE
ncbi:CLUMA_CG004537, isoform A [Clunio marinus]|uniref:CLUMA_CG004537, isoform A n=1 Tax=Clunio marinus TaxID=568069 RepID=A0A1J1HS17_9DIPT|nr:CLUMA_CG004537, isoform A [Clunio marinus]